ncbi:MAG: TetR/AcrR family transcriptional regulator [Gammaproteobacteria bacterium]|nr:TetR/AcrR family transcriptional regulator [Gammaproteobacteria bacterium]
MDARNRILQAFRELVLSEYFDEFNTQDVIDRSGVARSTFYQYFRDKNDLLLQSLSPILSVLSDACRNTCSVDELCEVLEHIWANRQIGRIFFQPALAALLIKSLTEAMPANGCPVHAHFVANGIVGVLGAWVRGSFSMAPRAVAEEILQVGGNIKMMD